MTARRRWLQLAFAGTLVLLCAVMRPPSATGQGVYGRVRGVVTDSLGPLPGARIVLVGTAFVATTDSDGAYAIERVPAGVYTARVETARRHPLEAAGVRVPSAGTAIVAVRFGGGGITIGAAGDELASRTRLSGRLLSRLPIDDNRQGLALASGVVLHGTDLGIAAAPDLSIRGSGADQTAVTVDGAPVRFETAGMSQLALATGSIAEVSVVTGAAPASVAGARGATIAYVTRAGGPRFEAGLSTGTDGLFSRSSTVGYNRFEGFAGGPVPRVQRLTWFVSGALDGQSSLYRGAGADTVPTFALAGVDTVVTYALSPGDPGSDSGRAILPRFAQVSGDCGRLGGDSGATARQMRGNYGLACQGLRRTLDWSTSRRVQAKLQYTYGEGSSVSLTALASDFQHRDNPGQDLADNASYAGVRAASRLAVVNWSHRLEQVLGGAIRVEAGLSLGGDDYQSGPLDRSSELATEAPALGIEFSRLSFSGLDGLPLPLTDAVVRQMRTNAFRPPYYGRNDLGAGQAFRFNPYGVMGGWPTAGLAGEATVISETRVDGRLSAEWQAAANLVVSAGGDFSRTDLSYYASPIIPTIGWTGSIGRPRRSGLFVEARLDAGPFTLEAGARGDRYVTGSDFPTAPGRIYSNPAWMTGDTSYAARISRVFTPGRSQSLVTPSVRAAFRVDDRTAARIAYSRQVELPPFAVLFANVNTDLASASTSTPFGRDVSYVTSSLIEGGIRHEFPSGLALDVSAYDKTNVMPYAFTATNLYDPFIGGDPSQPNESVFLLSARSGTRAMGGEVGLAWGTGRPFSGMASYSLAQTRLSETAALPVLQGPVDVTTQAVVGTVTWRVPEGWARGSALGTAMRGLSATVAGRLTSGEPYTPLLNGGVGTLAPYNGYSGNPLGELYSAHLPWTKTLDLRLAKEVTVGRGHWTVYAEARNLLNVSNLVGLFAETGTEVNDLFRASLFAPQLSSLRADAGALWSTRQVTVNGVTQSLQGVDLSDCSQYPQGAGGTRGVVDCIALRRVEARWGNGDGFYDTNEVNRALGAWYDAFYGTWRFHAPARTARVGLELEF